MTRQCNVFGPLLLSNTRGRNRPRSLARRFYAAAHKTGAYSGALVQETCVSKSRDVVVPADGATDHSVELL